MRLLVRLKGEGPRCFPSPKLKELGFKATRAEYYLVFDIKDMNPVKGIDPYKLKLRAGSGRSASYFTTLDKLL